MRQILRVIVVLLAAFLPVGLMADTSVFEVITVANSSIAITSTTYKPTGLPPKSSCVLTLETAQIRWRADGTAPTASVGHIMDIGGVLTITDPLQMFTIRFIRTGATSGALSVTCS